MMVPTIARFFAIALLALATTGCVDEDELRSWCRTHAGFVEAEPIAASTVFIPGSARFESIPRWGSRMLASGFRKVETTLGSSMDRGYEDEVPYSLRNSVIRLTLAPLGDPRCTHINLFARNADARFALAGEKPASNAHLEGLPDGTCIALEYASATSSEVALVAEDVGGTSFKRAKRALGTQEWRYRYELRDVVNVRVHASYFDGGYYLMPIGGGAGVGETCKRDDDARRIAALVVPRDQRAASVP